MRIGLSAVTAVAVSVTLNPSSRCHIERSYIFQHFRDKLV